MITSASVAADGSPNGNPPVAAHIIEFNDTKPALRRNDAMPVAARASLRLLKSS
jgi:hypothetical protein